jgi:MFS family permease
MQIFDSDSAYNIENTNFQSQFAVNNSPPVSKIKKTTSKCKYCCFSLCFLCHFVCPCCKYYSIKMYVLILSLMILSYTMISSGYISGIMSSLQRQYNMPTSKIGIILSSFDIISIFSVPIVSYFGAKTNRPRLIAIFSLIYILGCGIFILPYFLGSKYIVNSSDKPVNTTIESLMYDTFDLCKIIEDTDSQVLITRVKNNTVTCTRDNTNLWSYYVFITGQLAMSLGVSPLFSLGLTYLCDNVEERSHALYTGKKFL